MTVSSVESTWVSETEGRGLHECWLARLTFSWELRLSIPSLLCEKVRVTCERLLKRSGLSFNVSGKTIRSMCVINFAQSSAVVSSDNSLYGRRPNRRPPEASSASRPVDKVPNAIPSADHNVT
ncbi:hypothetical protein TcCL_ESM07882 [Trypanosoma cruzi]|nr:hypothetical protein TcCL_ESM07882 [Trypanosoma cruzi]